MTDLIRVLELGDSVASAYAAKLLGDHGADVVKVEPPEGTQQRRRDALFRVLNVNKRSVVAEPHDSAMFGQLIDWADIVVHDMGANDAQSAGLDAAAVTATHPHLVVLALTPFGQSGPYANFAATELILSNAGGWANLCPSTHTDPDLPPLKVVGEQCQLMTAIAGAAAALASYREAQRCGVGEHIDLSVQSYVASTLEAALPTYSYRGEIVNRTHQRSLIPWRIFQAQDAPVFVVCVEEDQWQRLVAFMGNPDWAELELFATHAGRAENQDLIHGFVQEFVSEWRAMEFYHAAQKHRICVAPVMDLQQIAANEHLRERGFFVTVDGNEYLSAAIIGNAGRAAVRMAPPALGEHQDAVVNDIAGAPPRVRASTNIEPANKPLQGVRVLDMTWAWAGPYCSMNLAHLGAEVIRLESPTRPDLYRRLPIYPTEVVEAITAAVEAEGPQAYDPGAYLNQSGMFNQWNQGKYSMALNLTDPASIDIIKQLVAVSDVVVQNFATGVLERLGLGYAVLADINPRIILASVSGYGQSGPYKDYMGYGPAIPPLTGLSAGTGYRGGDAEEVGLSMPDPTAGITATWAVVSALEQRDRTGTGDHLDVTLWESTGVLNAEAWMDYAMHGQLPVRNGNRSDHMAPHTVVRTRDEAPTSPANTTVEEADATRWIAIACENDAQWQALAGMLGLERDERFATLRGRKANEDELEALLADWTADQDRWALTERLQAAGIPAFPSLDCADVVNDPHLNARGFIERLKHPEVGVRAHAGIPWRLHRRQNGVTKPAPCIGEDTERLLNELLNK